MPNPLITRAAYLLPVARALATLAQTDVPNYRPASTQARCANCANFDGAACNLYDFAADYDYICDRYAARAPAQELRALVEKLGARNSRMDASRIQQVHDLCVQLGAECPDKGEEHLRAIGKKKASLVKQHLAGKHNQKRHGWKYGGNMTPERARKMGKEEFLEWEGRRISRKNGVIGKNKQERIKHAEHQAELKTKQRYKIQENLDGTYNLKDTNRKTSAGFSVSIKENLSKEEVEDEFQKRVKSAKTKAKKQQEQREPSSQDYDLLVN